MQKLLELMSEIFQQLYMFHSKNKTCYYNVLQTKITKSKWLSNVNKQWEGAERAKLTSPPTEPRWKSKQASAAPRPACDLTLTSLHVLSGTCSGRKGGALPGGKARASATTKTNVRWETSRCQTSSRSAKPGWDPPPFTPSLLSMSSVSHSGI